MAHIIGCLRPGSSLGACALSRQFQLHTAKTDVVNRGQSFISL
jgi:hypothetical protein